MTGRAVLLRALELALVAAAAFGCARHVPPSRPGAALYRDLERIVGLKETTGWHIDRLELDGVLSAALDSTCRVKPEVREQVRAWLEREIAAAGGPVEIAYARRGRDLSRVKRLLTLTRIRMALDRAMQATDECPFWTAPSDGFAGRQVSDDRWQLSLGGGGKGILVRRGGEGDLRFGGAGRLLIGRTFGSRAGLYTGLELGGNGAFPRDDAGERGNLVLGVDSVVPLVYRHTLVSSYFEVEAGWLATATETSEDFQHGIHLGAAFGGRATRTRWFFPGAAIGIGWERTFPDDGPALYLFKVGARVAFDIDL